MGCISASERARLEEKLTRLESMIEKFEDALSNFDHVAGYTFDSGEGRQSTTYYSIADIERTLRRIESRANRIRRKLNGTTNPAMNLRRKRGCYGYY